MNAEEIVQRLQVRHSKDLCAPEITCGPAGSPRLDFWAMPRSWSNWETVGYEIKVSRGDFLGDDKLHRYREFVHRLALVCPWGLIEPGECPDGVGLVWATKKGDRLVTKRKPAVGDPPEWDLPVRSALINRVPQIEAKGLLGRLEPSTPEERREAMREWLEGRAEDRHLGHAVSSRLWERLIELRERERKVARQERDLESYRAQAEIRGRHGLLHEDFEAICAAASQGGLSGPRKRNLEGALRRAERALESAREALEVPS